MPDLTPSDARIRAALRTARERAGLSQPELARALKWAQSKVSRLETGPQRVTFDVVAAWLAATNTPDDERAEILRTIEASTARALAWGPLYGQAGGMAAQQAQYAELEAMATRIAVFQPAVVPGLAQTPEYARRVFELFGREPHQIPAAVAARMDRQRVLHEPGRDITFVITEPALRLRVGPVGVLLEQLDRLASLVDLPSVTLGIVPMGILAPALPLSNYELLQTDTDGRAFAEVLYGQVDTGGDEGVAEYVADLQKWLAVAALGESARAELARIRGDLTSTA